MKLFKNESEMTTLECGIRGAILFVLGMVTAGMLPLFWIPIRELILDSMENNDKEL